MWNSLFNLLTTSLICCDHVKFSSSVIPRNFIWVVLFSCLSRKAIWSGRFCTFFLLDLKIVKEDLSAFKVSLLALNHDDNWVIMILAISIMLSILSLWKNMVVSSEHILTLPEGKHVERSLMNDRKSSGPKTEPWGTSNDTDLV